MTRWQEMVREFHRKFGIPIVDKPAFPADARVQLRIDLIDEEVVKETYAAMCADSGEKDIAEVADGIGDSIYVLIGTALEFGIDLDPVMEAIHAANMKKEGGPTRADGKILKPKGWKAPDIAGVLARQSNPGPSMSVDDGDEP